MSRTAAVELFLHVRGDAGGHGARPEGDVDPRAIELCEELDWWPPAVQLAGRRAAVQTVDELLTALRHRTLESVLDPAGDARAPDTIASAVSAGLDGLPESERTLLAAVAPLSDWWTLDEVRDLIPGGGGSLAALTSLIAQDLVRRTEDRSATLFRVNRAYRERLGSSLTSGCIESLRRSATEAVEGLLTASTRGGDAAPWYGLVGRRRCDVERAAELSLSHDPVVAGELVLALCIHAAELTDFSRAGVLLDRCVDALIRLDDTGSSDQRSLSAMLHGYQLHRRAEAVDPTIDLNQLAAEFERAVNDADALEDPRVTLAVMAHSVRAARTIGHVDQAARHASAALELAESHGLPVAAATFELLGAMAAHNQQRFADAAVLAVRAHTHARRLGLDVTAALASLLFRQLPVGTPNLPPVLPSPDDVLDMVTDSAAGRSSLGVSYGVAVESFLAGNLATAARATAAGIRTADRIGLPAGVGNGVMIAVLLASTTGNPDAAAQLHGGILDQLDVLLHGVSPGYRALYDHCVAAARTALGDDRFEKEISRGVASTLAALTERAVLFLDRLASRVAVASPAMAALTQREIEVLTLLAAGASNKRIATDLGISAKTVMHHTSNIYRKLGVQGRVEATALAHREGIIA